ncbi:hypothetical protein CONPUDRAFT_84531 [Coniophora puteana RWD-64-598 SS2]|uniref:Uncharacterized protein n=1 Tax=Coniophora puteana (strain RWD-64-598) TaxID=741705 RepID=A0A5M3MFT8_CONPW|nr:uncharacterized protein CONPUDRAFT_84531 [Coniophora puteana RWD-64-598 SS2]EIW77461.1 hypothetical protein CONPUDRAFT_84531 [Coniophora puteana RWD-64-598 SS2]
MRAPPAPGTDSSGGVGSTSRESPTASPAIVCVAKQSFGWFRHPSVCPGGFLGVTDAG